MIGKRTIVKSSFKSLTFRYSLSGALGEGKEGMINIIFAFAPVDAPAQPYRPVTGLQAAVQPPQGQMPANAPPPQQPLEHTARDVQPNEPRFTEEDVKELAEMFPNIAPDVIESVLVEKSGNKNAAVNALLSIAEN